jgi:hypothetical protein
MTSLKVKYADEIAESMAKTLGDEEFLRIHRVAFDKKAATPAAEEFYRQLPNANSVSEIDALVAKYAPQMSPAEKEQAVEDAEKKKEEISGSKGPGTTVPEISDTQFADEGDGCPESDCNEEFAIDPRTLVAIDYTLNHLVKIADVLDKNGFNEIANLIDEASKKIAGKKKVTKEG